MRILVLNTDYAQFQHRLYTANPGLADEPYAVQMAARNDTLFGVADFYSRNFTRHGHEAVEIHANNDVIQSAWAREHGMDRGVAPENWLGKGAKNLLAPILGPVKRRLFPGGMKPYQADVVRAQIAEFDPDIILNQEMGFVRTEFLRSVKRPGRRIIGQIAAALPQGENFNVYDLVITSLPNFVNWFRARGIKAQLNRLGFDPVVLEKMGAQPVRDIELSFVGSLSPEHADRIALLEKIARELPLKVWGNGIARLPLSSPLHAIYQGEVWGREMYDVLRRSRVTLNHHINLAGEYANNMRLYEATGAGALLLTDIKTNLSEMFELEKEVATYGSAGECINQVHRYLAQEDLRTAVAAEGQSRTLRDHSYFIRTGEILALADGLV